MTPEASSSYQEPRGEAAPPMHQQGGLSQSGLAVYSQLS